LWRIGGWPEFGELKGLFTLEALSQPKVFSERVRNPKGNIFYLRVFRRITPFKILGGRIYGGKYWVTGRRGRILLLEPVFFEVLFPERLFKTAPKREIFPLSNSGVCNRAVCVTINFWGGPPKTWGRTKNFLPQYYAAPTIFRRDFGDPPFG